MDWEEEGESDDSYIFIFMGVGAGYWREDWEDRIK